MLHWKVSFDGPWSEIAEDRYRQGGFDGLSLVPSSAWVPSDLDFLYRLDGLRSFSLNAKVKNDIAAFKIPSLEHLSLVTGSRLRVPEEIQPLLLRLVMTDRPGVDVQTHWPALESLRLGAWKGTDLQLLNGTLNLRHFRVEGRRHAGTLDGIENCRALEELVTVNYSISNTEPLRGLKSLTELRMMAARPAIPHGIVDISDLSDSRLAKLWISNAANIRQLAVLAEMPSLREVRLIQCRLTQADQLVLDTLPSKVRVEVEDSRIID